MRWLPFQDAGGYTKQGDRAMVVHFGEETQAKILESAVSPFGLKVFLSVHDKKPYLEFAGGEPPVEFFRISVHVEDLTRWLLGLADARGQLGEIGWAIDLIREKLEA